ncbi:transcriptional regulator [Acuticoccus sediminis]|uniref:Transcriptional regulator n=1 Tax=Acuticoccus sediminis TaxID=2184697 RepID=A0A8B2NUW9_9HYPH|nr:YafY family protein [Acuticoccus sediminis]RAI03977.1 transcriptional regulator [Acuticoccus sediminis]
MSRAHRLFLLLEALRRRRRPVTGQVLAEELGVSLRTLYRDIDGLRAQGARIDGEAGIGFVLRPGFTVPPLMFTSAEIEALVLGSRWVAARADTDLAAAAENALEKIAGVVPEHAREELEATTLIVPPGERHSDGFAIVRDAIRRQTKLRLDYRDAGGAVTARTVWPVAVGYFDSAHILVAWCELRNAYRHFRADRIARVEPTEERLPRPRRALHAEWLRVRDA